MLNQKERKVVGDYIRKIANQMNLKDWTINLLHNPCAEHLEGNVDCIYGQRQANISLGEWFRERSLEEQRETIVHELCHAHFAPCWRMVQTDLTEPLGKVAYYVFCDAFRSNMEYAIDAFAKTIAPKFPFIDWTQLDKKKSVKPKKKAK